MPGASGGGRAAEGEVPRDATVIDNACSSAHQPIRGGGAGVDEGVSGVLETPTDPLHFASRRAHHGQGRQLDEGASPSPQMGRYRQDDVFAVVG